MAMTYTEFKTFLVDTLWRQNDTDLSNNLDKFITIAENELSRSLTIQQREAAVVIAPTTQDYTLPADFKQIMSVSNMNTALQIGTGPMMATTLSNIITTREATNSSYVSPMYYAKRGSSTSTLYLSGPFSVANPGMFNLQYRAGVPDFAADDASWLEDEYLDLYMYTVFKHVAIFLREDERMQTYAAYAQAALDLAIDEDLRQVRFGGSSLEMKPSRTIPRTFRR
tara:strand:- start:32426 stop:33100 length:675 start_codon:yes stop_codon:yes gene_type:complete